MRAAELDYDPDTPGRFADLADDDWSVMLDSGRERLSGARYDIYAADPFVTLTTRGPATEIVSRTDRKESDRDPLELLREALGPPVAGDVSLPFTGGALGYFAYDLGRRFERLPSLARDDLGLPEMAVGIYDWAVVVDHYRKKSWLVGQGRDERTFDRWDALLARASGTAARSQPLFEITGPIETNFDRAGYGRAFAKISAHIRKGDCYQVNLAQRFSAPIAGSSFGAYRQLRDTTPAPFSAYLNLPDGEILSSSPERFLRIRDGRVVTQPIKGTRPRGADRAEDRALISELRNSAKDRAENVMIVDLLRNDLGRTCAPGSVRATELFAVETFANVHHLVSTVEGRIGAGRHAVDVLRGAFPGGSITGAPKVRAMQIIEECEPERRSVYCGAIGYVGADGGMDTNIAIRTLVRVGDRIHGWAGSGIVADSDPDLEYQECFDKAAGLLNVLSGADPAPAGGIPDGIAAR